jgi:hypothetical protein
VPYGALGLAALSGRESETGELIKLILSEVVSRGEGIGVTVTLSASAVLGNGLGRYEQALAAAPQANEYRRSSGSAPGRSSNWPRQVSAAGRPGLSPGPWTSWRRRHVRQRQWLAMARDGRKDGPGGFRLCG